MISKVRSASGISDRTKAHLEWQFKQRVNLKAQTNLTNDFCNQFVTTICHENYSDAWRTSLLSKILN